VFLSEFSQRPFFRMMCEYGKKSTLGTAPFSAATLNRPAQLVEMDGIKGSGEF
jgi:hypothetical protein